MSTHHFRTEAEWRAWFDDAEQRATRTAAEWERWCAEQTALLEKAAGPLHYTTPVPIRMIAGSATDAGQVPYRKPFPLRRRRGR